MHPALVIAGKDLRQRLRDRSAVVLGVLAPLVISGLMAMAFHGISSLHFTVGYVDHDRGRVAAAFHDELTSPQLRNLITLVAYPDTRSASRAVDSGKAQAALVVPQGFSAGVSATSGAPAVTVLTSADYTLDGQVARAVAESFVAQLNADRLSVAAAVAAGAPAGRLARLAADAARLQLPAEVRAQSTGTRSIKPISYYAPGMATFFVMFAIAFGSRSYFVEQSDGTLDRISAAPVRRGAVLLGKSLSTFVYGMLSLSTLAVTTTVAFGANWGNPAGVLAICVAMAVAVVALTALVIALSRTERQAEGIASIVVFVLALLGGNFVFISAAPALVRRLSLYTPNGWAIRAFTDMSSGVTGAGTVLVPFAAMLGIAAGVAAVVLLLLRRGAAT